MLTRLLRQATARVGAKYGLEPDDVSARSMRASGAMALLCAEVDPVKIQLMGRWRSDCMLRYLFVQADSIVRDFSTQMVACGDFSFLPNTPVHDLVTKEQDSSFCGESVAEAFPDNPAMFSTMEQFDSSIRRASREHSGAVGDEQGTKRGADILKRTSGFAHFTARIATLDMITPDELRLSLIMGGVDELLAHPRCTSTSPRGSATLLHP
ncbi:hypothetical protein THAOC_20338, partial [Thalassiosira oceanica]